MDASAPPLAVEGVTVRLGERLIVRNATLAIGRGEIVGVSGPAGGGKSTLALAMLNLARPPAEIVGGAVRIGGQDLRALAPEAQRQIRGKDVALIMQNARAALDPLATVGRQIARVLEAHGKRADPQSAIDLLSLVGVNDAPRRLHAYPHELSGGMAQRALIAIALAADPRVLVADEPASGLDVTIQAQFLDAMALAARERGLAMLIATQERGVLSNYCDRVLIMADGVLSDAASAKPNVQAHRAPAPVQAAAPVAAAVRGVHKRFPLRDGKGAVHAVNDVTLEIRAGESVGLVGESGSGKSTLGRCLLRLISADAGMTEIGGADLGKLSNGALRDVRRQAQLVRQDPFDSFNPRWTVAQSVREPLDIHESLSIDAQLARVRETLALVGCADGVADAYPHQLSAGDLQRAALARALIAGPKLLVLDEPTSLLAPDARAGLVTLLRRLQDELGLAYLFISHDLTTVAQLCSRIAVMYLGQIVESGPADALFHAPAHPYTRALFAAHLDEAPAVRRIDRLAATEALRGDIPSPIDLPPGCFLASRCPHVEPACTAARQVLTAWGDRTVRCRRVVEGTLPPAESPHD